MPSLHHELRPPIQPRRLSELLAHLSSLLRQRADPLLPHHPVEALAERVTGMTPEHWRCLHHISRAHRAALEELIAAELDPPGTDLPLLMRSLEAMTDAVLGAHQRSDPAYGRAIGECRELLDIRYADCDLSELVFEACDAFVLLAKQRSIELRVHLDRGVRAEIDVAKVFRAVLNLTFNAFKVTPAGGVVEVSLDADDRLREATITVVDSGPGVPSQSASSIFQRNLRSDRNSEITAGWLGLELGTSRDYARLHGGDLRLVHRPCTEGAEFRITLPMRAPAGIPVDASAVIDRAFAERVARTASEELHIEDRLGDLAPVRDNRPLVLVVEDSRAMQRMLVDALRGSCATASAFDGSTGLRLTAELHPDLIITDLLLPEMDGASMLLAIRNHPDLADIPVLVVSGSMGASKTVELLRQGAQDVLRKPLLVPELRARVHNLLEAKRARDILGQLVGQRESDLGQLAAEVDRHQRRLEAALAELSIAREQAESASQVKSNFLRMISHELKTPVTALLLQKQILASDPILREAPEHVAQSLASISRSIARLLQIVDTMLEWARVESGRVVLNATPFHLYELANHAAVALRERAENRGVTIDVVSRDPDPLPLVSDRSLVRLILMNILDRALSLTKDAPLRVRVDREGHQHRIEIGDGGPVLSAAERQELFDPFGTSIDLGRRGGTGSGLGLHVVRDLAVALGGTVSIPTERAESYIVLTLVDLPEQAAEKA